MLTRQDNISPSQQYYADTMLTPPSIKQSVFDNFAAGVVTPNVGLEDLDSTFAQRPEGKAIHDTLNAVEMESQTPGMNWFGQKGADWIANMIGYGINPISWGFGEIGSLAARGLGLGAEAVAPDAVSAFMRKPLNSVLAEPLAKWLPTEIGKEGEQKTLSAGLLSQNTIDNFGTGAGAFVPASIDANFNQDNGNIAWGGVARDAGEMGALGIAIGSLPFAAGIIRGKVNRPMGEDPSGEVTPETLSDALAKGNITPEEHAWYTDYLEATKPTQVWDGAIIHSQHDSEADAQQAQAYYSKEPENKGDSYEINEDPNTGKFILTRGKKASRQGISPDDMSDLEKRATQIIGDNGQPVNSVTNEAPFDFFSSNDVKNLNAVVPDQLIADVPENARTALSDYLVNNRLDALRENPQALDGVRGYVDHINQKLDMKSSKLAESDKILDDHLTKGVKENIPFSQKELFKHMRKAGFEESHIRQLPVTIPENIGKHLKAKDDIDAIEKVNKDLNKRLSSMREQGRKNRRIKYQNQIANNDAKIAKINENLPKILTPKEELEDIRKTLITDKGLPKNYERSTAYHRLLDLAHVWKNARTLLDRVNMENEYNKQEAYKTLCEHVLKVADSDLPRLAQPDNVINYLKARIEGSVNKSDPMQLADIQAKAKSATEIPQDADSILSEQDAQVKNSAAKDLSKEFNDASEKFKEFKSSENIFKNLISCVLGGMNG